MRHPGAPSRAERSLEVGSPCPEAQESGIAWLEERLLSVSAIADATMGTCKPRLCCGVVALSDWCRSVSLSDVGSDTRTLHEAACVVVSCVWGLRRLRSPQPSAAREPSRVVC